jgi:Na+/proline symporter
VGLLVAVILSAAMSSTASELNALGTTTSVDFYKTSWRPQASDREMLFASQGFTVLWGGIAIGFALLTSLFDNLIELINILGSLFYSAVLGIFLVEFFVHRITARSVFWGTIVAESCVLGLYSAGRLGFIPEIGYLWFNVLGCLFVFIFGAFLEFALFARRVRV